MTTSSENDNRPLAVLRVDSSARGDASTSRALSDRVIEKLKAEHGDVSVTLRDVSAGLPMVDGAWLGATFTDPAERSDDQKATLSLSDTLIDELRAADVLVIGVPVYNFQIPAALKSWIDLVARARETFQYTESGPEGLLKGKKAILTFASGGVDLNGVADFTTPYLKFMLGFLGITDVQVVAADRQNLDETAVDRATAEIEQLAA
ncbi:FMN-dependent NADH-azoreductase [Rhodospirillaceae bacterium KN72]|uniref:FMN dependent NADH:quinone oxidoreductase n=1 Tax=Pacificispira spongiicola TaxID=2729598 RepID=A0A7Y0HEY6_9PROT|nr:NAD(P)H-dependent oxidoreductase [Pacificispira spongiicola]NMM45366.1 FMN-dependent NADH-azoreductase [Pacificispira spongiicola]